MPIAGRPRFGRQAVIDVKRKRLLNLVTSHKHFGFLIAPICDCPNNQLTASSKSAISNLKSKMFLEWLADSGSCSPERPGKLSYGAKLTGRGWPRFNWPP